MPVPLTMSFCLRTFHLATSSVRAAALPALAASINAVNARPSRRRQVLCPVLQQCDLMVLTLSRRLIVVDEQNAVFVFAGQYWDKFPKYSTIDFRFVMPFTR
jgi:hypothetical protein